MESIDIRQSLPAETKKLANDQRRRQLHILNILLLIILLGLFLLSFSRVINYEQDINRTGFTVQGRLAVPVLEMQPQHQKVVLTAIVAHGFSGSKELMSSIGVELAHAGIAVYLFDFPGHGQSLVPAHLDDQGSPDTGDNLTVLDEVVQYVRKHQRSPMVLLGHSMGSAVVGSYALAHKDDTDLAATILLSPVGQERPTQQDPQNLLLLVGQNDLPVTLTNSARLLQQGCKLAQTPALSSPQECGAPGGGTGRRAVVLPGLNHLTILNSATTFDEMLKWLHRIDSGVKTTDMRSNLRLFWLIFGAVSILLAIFPLSALLIDIFDISAAVRVLSGLDVGIYTLCLLIGVGSAIAIQYAWLPFSFLRIALADYVSGYFLIVSLVSGLLFLLLRRKVAIAPLSQVVRQCALGVLIAVVLYLTLGELLTFAWQRFSITFTLPRVWRFLVLFVLVLPAFLLDEGVSRGYQERNAVRGILVSVLFKALLVVGLFVSLRLTPGISFLSIVLPLLAILFIVLLGYTAQAYISGRAALAGAILSALLTAWCLASSFPIT